MKDWPPEWDAIPHVTRDYTQAEPGTIVEEEVRTGRQVSQLRVKIERCPVCGEPGRVRLVRTNRRERYYVFIHKIFSDMSRDEHQARIREVKDE